MIKIGNFGITSDSHGYTVGKVSTVKDKKTGEESEVITSAKYYSNLQGCLRSIRKQMHFEAIKEFDGNMSEAIQLLNATDERFEALIANVEKV